MKCPYCGTESIKVIDSRPSEENNAIRRRRQCENCEKRFTTYETVESMPLIIVKKDNSREPYSRDKLMSGLVRSCHKRPVAMKSIDALVDDIENQLYNAMKKEVDSSQIGEIAMEGLKSLDEVAYVRFASIYREFRDINTFMDELKKILKEK
ncbi:negative regulator of transcription of ribonucleotide reductase nrd genes and operons [Petrocella atlantisensis]|uniref:Transcriptional repressor NrdR n=1 Tax=Petrocella atlantisensis TaxID=2173034 RepID=A0A3P7PPD7_9FIRM|nr:transcriptional regulator NrdR [Petrocella atlantisensis]MCF8018452.1 transcriptional regulator NrdR [Vallitaleaceae bacterium]PKM53725.1 MAG: transcriptional regulator NrdR [Firmicutes bacterium HGW-Firmicutes-5]VDN46337.1 negative regulator of transcription of ribonucleotide reductase nrd genes and operons [Petrocella atlantisensis]